MSHEINIFTKLNYSMPLKIFCEKVLDITKIRFSGLNGLIPCLEKLVVYKLSSEKLESLTISRSHGQAKS